MPIDPERLILRFPDPFENVDTDQIQIFLDDAESQLKGLKGKDIYEYACILMACHAMSIAPSLKSIRGDRIAGPRVVKSEEIVGETRIVYDVPSQTYSNNATGLEQTQYGRMLQDLKKANIFTFMSSSK